MAWDETTGIPEIDELLRRGVLPRAPGMVPRPVGQPDASGWRHPVDLAAEAAASKPTVPRFTGPKPEVEAPDVAGMPAGVSANPGFRFTGAQPAAPAAAATAPAMTRPTPSFTGSQPAAPAAAATAPAMTRPAPSFTMSANQKALQELQQQGRPGSPEGPQLSWWKRVLDTVAQAHPLGRLIERNIPGSPGNYDAELARKTAAVAGDQTRAERQQQIDTQAAQAQFNTPEKRQAYMEANPGQFEGVSDFEKNDFILSGKFPQREPAAAQAKIAYHYTNSDGREVSVYEDGTEKVGGQAQAKAGKHSPGEVKLDEGIPTGIYGEQDRLYRAGDPNMPPEIKAALQDAVKAHNQKFQEDLQKQREGRSVYTAGKAINFIMPDGTVRSVNGLEVADFMKDNPDAVMTGAGVTEHAMSKGAQFKEIHTGIDKARKAINGLDRGFTPEQIGKLTLAMRHTEDPSIFKTELETLLGTQQLTPAQQDLVIWLGHLNERALSIRNIAGMGQGSDSMRAAIQAVLPNLKSGSKEMMLKQLAAFENQVNNLEAGVPKMPGNKAGGGTAGALPPGWK